jgi:hypothetical protein
MTAPKNISAEEGMQDECILPRVIFIRATMSGLLYPLLPFAMLKENPITEVQQYIKLHNVDTRNSMMMRSAWNKPFNTISSDAIYFVCAWNSVPEATPRTLRAAGMTFIIASCGPHHTRWLTTRPMLRSGELVVWCVEIDMHAPQFERVVTLSEANMIQLVPGLQLPQSRAA